MHNILLIYILVKLVLLQGLHCVRVSYSKDMLYKKLQMRQLIIENLKWHTLLFQHISLYSLIKLLPYRICSFAVVQHVKRCFVLSIMRQNPGLKDHGTVYVSMLVCFCSRPIDFCKWYYVQTPIPTFLFEYGMWTWNICGYIHGLQKAVKLQMLCAYSPYEFPTSWNREKYARFDSLDNKRNLNDSWIKQSVVCLNLSGESI